MSSIEIFTNNVKRHLAQRNIRIKDLAARIGLSESYLSLVLNGTRKNLNDEYKDRIASVLNIPVSLLYAENVPVKERDDYRAAFVDPSRHELKDLIEAFLTKANLHHRRASFYLVLGSLNDRDVHALQRFFAELLKEFAGEDSRAGSADLLGLPEDHVRLLAMYSIAGDNARLEWVRAISELPQKEFDRITEHLRERGLITLLEDTDTARVRVLAHFGPISSLFGQSKIRDIYLNLARTMQLYPDEGPFFHKELGEALVRALQDREAAAAFEKAAAGFKQRGLLEEAASSWHASAVVHGLLDHSENKGRCLSEAARCAAEAGNYPAAIELAEYASSVLEAAGLSKLHANACNLFGSIFTSYDLEIATFWYRKGLEATSPNSELYGPLLINLATSYLCRGKAGEAENALREAKRWTEGRKSPDAVRVLSHQSLLMGLIEFERRNWKSAKEHFASCIETGKDAPPEDIATAWHNLGMIMYRMDNMAEARKHLMIAQEINKSKNLLPRWASGLIETAKVALREGKREEALELLDEAIPHLDKQSLHERGWVWLIEGCIHKMGGRLSEAVDAGRKAVDYFQREGSQRDLACSALWLSHVFDEMGMEQESHLMQKRAFQIYDKGRWDVRELHRECSLLSPSQSSTARGVEVE